MAAKITTAEYAAGAVEVRCRIGAGWRPDPVVIQVLSRERVSRRARPGGPGPGDRRRSAGADGHHEGAAGGHVPRVGTDDRHGQQLRRGQAVRTGRFLPADALRERFAALGVIDGASVVSYCGSGVTACHNPIALELAGLGGGRLYAGSWSQYGADPDRPVATGAEP